MSECVCKTEWRSVWYAGVVLAGVTLAVPGSALAEGFFDSLLSLGGLLSSPGAEQPRVRAANGLIVYNNAPRSWAHLPATVYASVPTVEGRYPIHPQNVAAGMPVQSAPLRPVVVQTRPTGVYAGGEE